MGDLPPGSFGEETGPEADVLTYSAAVRACGSKGAWDLDSTNARVQLSLLAFELQVFPWPPRVRAWTSLKPLKSA